MRSLTVVFEQKKLLQPETESMSKEKREKERAAWRELKIVIHNYRALGDCAAHGQSIQFFLFEFLIQGFNYLIRRPSQQNVCFGSTIEREACTVENNKMSSFMRRIGSKPSVSSRKSVSPSFKKVYVSPEPFDELKYCL